MNSAPCPRSLALATNPAMSQATGPAQTSSKSFQSSPRSVRSRFPIEASPWSACAGSEPSNTAGVRASSWTRSQSRSRWVNVADGRSSRSRPSSQSRIARSGARSPGNPASAACSSRSERPSSRGSGTGAGAARGMNFHIVIHNPSRSYGRGGSRSVGGTTGPVRSARKAATATSRASHCSGSSCSIAVPVITRATTGAGLRCTSTLLPAAIRTASSQATPCSRAMACAAASAAASSGGPWLTAPGDYPEPDDALKATPGSRGYGR